MHAYYIQKAPQSLRTIYFNPIHFIYIFLTCAISTFESSVVFRFKEGVRKSKFLALIENLAEIKHCLTYSLILGRAKSCLNQKSCLKWTCLKQKTTVLLTSQTLNANALWNQEVIRFRNTSRALRTKAWNVSFPEFLEFRREFLLESLI